MKADGSIQTRKISWFGYKIHLIVDADYELPIAYRVSKASEADNKGMQKLLNQLENQSPHLLHECQYFMGDKGYDDIKLHRLLLDQFQIFPIIDIRNMWRDGEQTRLLGSHSNVTHNHRGQLFCYCPLTGTESRMACGGYERSRHTFKFHCPSRHYGLTCLGKSLCPIKRSVRINCKKDPRTFCPVSRGSYKWKRLYAKRTSVERVNSRIDIAYGFDKHTIRGQQKMKIRLGLAFCVMLSTALGRVRQNQLDRFRSLVKAA